MSARVRLLLVSLVPVVVAAASCAPAKQTPRMPQELPVLALSQEPTLQIGVMEGDEHYLFQNVVSVLPLASGELAVSDAGANEVTVYADDGTFLRRWGGRGQGPGEFRMLSRIYPATGDSLMALDMAGYRFSVFDTAGNFARQVPATELSGDTLFSADEWLYGLFWVDGGMSAEARDRVKRALDHLPAPISAPGYRVVKVGADGRLWVREPEVDAQGARRWTVLSSSGQPEATIDIPERLEPQYLDAERVIGRWTGENDVNFVRVYDVARTGADRPTPAWLATPPDSTGVPPADEKEVRAQIVETLKQLAMAQEIHYSTHYTYTSDPDSLKWEKPEDLMVDFVNAGPRGWVAVFTHPGFDRICGLGYGYTTPPGWAPGRIICSPPAAR